MAMRVVMKAVKAGYQIVYKDVFECPTARALAELISGTTVFTQESVATQEVKDDKTPAGAPADPEIQDYDYTAILTAEQRGSQYSCCRRHP